MNRWIVMGLTTGVATAVLSHPVVAQPDGTGRATETRVPVGTASLYSRVIGRGQSIIVLHGGPDFDHDYLLPDMDRLQDTYRLIYYDQRGRGKSADGVQPEEVTLASDVEDLDKVRQHFRLDRAVVLGHSWGTVLALEYALRHPTRVSHLILMNPAPASASDVGVLRSAYLAKIGAEMDRQRAIMASTAYKEGDPAAVTARYRIHFRPAFRRADDYEKFMARMQAGFFRQGSAGILKAWAVEDRLYRDTWQIPGYDLMPKLRDLRIPTLVIWGDHDFIPIDISTHIAEAIHGAKPVTMKDCGHFAYLECGPQLRVAVHEFLLGEQAAPRSVADSIVLTRKPDACPEAEPGQCLVQIVVLRRAEVARGIMNAIVARAVAADFYRLPRDLVENVRWCQLVLPDALPATLAIYHGDRQWSVSGYHNCLGDASTTDSSPIPPEQKRLVALEALIDSVARSRRR